MRVVLRELCDALREQYVPALRKIDIVVGKYQYWCCRAVDGAIVGDRGGWSVALDV
jgi:hypothetical protein